MADPKADPKTKEGPSQSELDAAKAKLDALKRANELKLVLAEIEKLENGGKSPVQVKAEKEAKAKREKTHKEGNLAVYRLKERSFKPLEPGQPPALVEKGTLIRISVDTLPGASMEAVKKTELEAPAEFKSA